MKEIVKTSDFYEGGFYLYLNFTLEKIEVVKENGKLSGIVTFSGEEIKKKQLDYLNSNVSVNLIDFRKCFNRLKTLIYAEQKKVKGGNQ